jgi:hypothetical protein
MRSAPLTVSVLIQVGSVARTDAGAVGDRGPGGIGRRRSIEQAPLGVALKDLSGGVFTQREARG